MITRENYEEFFILYIDDELSMSDRQMVEKFLAENPDLEEEWENLQQCRISPDSDIAFPEKEMLLRQESISGEQSSTLQINEGNCEEYYLLYIDGELNEEERKAVEAFNNRFPLQLQEFMLLQQTVLSPDPNICFTNKEVLYRSEKERRLLPWWRIAAAAVLLLSAALLTLYIERDRTSRIAPHRDALAKTTPAAPAKTFPTAKTGEDAVTSPASDTLYLGRVTEKTKGKQGSASGTAAQKQHQARSGKEPAEDTGLALHDAGRQANRARSSIALSSLHEQGDPQASTLKNNRPSEGIAKISKVPGDLIAIDNTRQEDSQLKRENADFASQALMAENTGNGDDLEEPAPPRKNKLRGIFRRVSRVFEKPSNLDNEKQEILIGSFHVALK